MRFTPTEKYSVYANSQFKTLDWKVYLKKTNTLNESLTTGTWLDVTHWIQDIPDLTSNIEYEVGQFTSDNISLVGLGVLDWKENVFDGNTRIECKITYTLGRGTDTCTDSPIVFSGWVDTDAIEYNELANTVSFNVYTVQDYGTRVPAEYLSTKYINASLENGTVSGSYLFETEGIYVKDCNYENLLPLKVGVHTLEYKSEEVTERAGDDLLISGTFGPIQSMWTSNGGVTELHTIFNAISPPGYADAPAVNGWEESNPNVTISATTAYPSYGNYSMQVYNSGGNRTTVDISGLLNNPQINTVYDFSCMVYPDNAGILVDMEYPFQTVIQSKAPVVGYYTPFRKMASTGDTTSLKNYMGFNVVLDANYSLYIDGVSAVTGKWIITPSVQASTGVLARAGFATCCNSTGQQRYLSQAVPTLVSGKTYTVTAEIFDYVQGELYIEVGGTSSDAIGYSGPIEIDIVAGSSGVFRLLSTNWSGRIKNISLKVKEKAHTSYQMKLDDGEFTDLDFNTTNNTILYNKDADERCKLYVLYNPPAIVTSSKEEIIIRSDNTGLPYQWYHGYSAERLLKETYTLIGIDTVTFDTMQMNTYNGRQAISFSEQPPNDSSVFGMKQALETVGSDLYMAIGNKLFKKDINTNVYTDLGFFTGSILKPDITATRLIYNARNDHMWIIFDDNKSVTRYNIGSSTFETTIAINTTSLDRSAYSMELYDFEYSAGNWMYGLLHARVFHSVRFVNGVAWTDSAVLTNAGDLGYITGGVDGKFVFSLTTEKVYFSISAENDSFQEVYADAAGNWKNIPKIDNTAGGQLSWDVGLYNPLFSRIIFYHPETNTMRSQGLVNTTTVELSVLPTGSEVTSMVYYFGKTYFTARLGLSQQGLYVINSGLDSAHLLDNNILTINRSLVFNGNVLYGIDRFGRLFKYHTVLDFYVKVGAFTGMSITDALNKQLQAFNLVGNISSTKQAFVYRRADSAGTPQTTGNTFSISTDIVSDITERIKLFPKIDLMEISNDDKTYTYNGTSFGSKLLLDGKTLSLSNNLIPDEIIKDLLVQMYRFFSVSRTLYTFPILQLPMFQYEPFDNVNASFNTTRIQKILTGNGYPIYSTTIKKDGSMEITILA